MYIRFKKIILIYNSTFCCLLATETSYFYTGTHKLFFKSQSLFFLISTSIDFCYGWKLLLRKTLFWDLTFCHRGPTQNGNLNSLNLCGSQWNLIIDIFLKLSFIMQTHDCVITINNNQYYQMDNMWKGTQIRKCPEGDTPLATCLHNQPSCKWGLHTAPQLKCRKGLLNSKPWFRNGEIPISPESNTHMGICTHSHTRSTNFWVGKTSCLFKMSNNLKGSSAGSMSKSY